MTDKTFCDVCGKEIKRVSFFEMSIHAAAETKTWIPLKYQVQLHRGRKRLFAMLDICSKECFVKFLTDLKEGST